MGSKPRKAFDGVGRPQGIIDDVVYPIASKFARKVMQKSAKMSSDRSFDVYQKARQVKKKIDTKRIDSYFDKSNKLYRKESPNRSSKQITKSFNKREVLEAKMMGVEKTGKGWGGPRSRAKQVRRNQTAKTLKGKK